jgi:hypothetical protein
MEWIKLNTGKDQIPELEDNSVLVHFENGSIETVHIQDMFGEITDGLNEKGHQQYTRWYLNHAPKLTHWMPLPEPPKQ